MKKTCYIFLDIDGVLNTLMIYNEPEEGINRIHKDEFYYEGTILGEQVKKEFHLDLLTQLPFEPNVRFEVPDEEAMFRFIPKRDLRVITEYVMIIDFLNDEGRNNFPLKYPVNALLASASVFASRIALPASVL